MLAFSSPSAAASTMRARSTGRCSTAPLRANDDKRDRSSSLSTILTGLCLDTLASRVRPHHTSPLRNFDITRL